MSPGVYGCRSLHLASNSRRVVSGKHLPTFLREVPYPNRSLHNWMKQLAELHPSD